MRAVDSIQSAARIEHLVATDVSLAQARRHFAGRSPADLQSVYEGLGSEFWNSSRNRTLVLRAMVECSAAQEGPRRAVERFLALLGPDVTDRNRLVRIIGSAAFASERPSVNAVARAFAGIASETQTELLAGVAEARNQSSCTTDVYKFLVACAEKLGGTVTVEGRSRFLMVALRRACYSGFLDQADLVTLLESEALEPAHSIILAKVLCEVATSLPGALPELMGMLGQKHPDLIAGQGVLSEVPPELLRFALSSIPEKTRVNLLDSHAGSLLIQSPLQAVQFAREFEPESLPPKARASVARALLTSGGEELRSWIDGLSVGDKRDVLKGASIPSLVETWLLGVKRASSAMPELGRAWLVASQGISGLSEEEVVWAVHSAAGELEPEEFGQVLSLVPEELLPKAQDEAWRSYFLRLASNEPQDFTGVIGANAKNPDERAQLLRIAASALAVRAPGQAATWLKEAQDNPELQESLRSGLITNPSFPLQERSRILIECINRVPQHTVNPELMSGAEKLMADYLQTDYTKAVGFLDEIQNSALRESLTTALVKRWAAADPVTASEWIAELPPGSIGDSALRELVIASKDDPEIALKNATAISNPATRVEAAMKVVEAWKGADVGPLMAFLKSAKFSESERTQLEKAIQGFKP